MTFVLANKVTCRVFHPTSGRVIDSRTLPTDESQKLSASARLQAWVELQYPDNYWTIQGDAR